MRASLVFVLLLIPTFCLALGAEETFFIGVSSKGKITRINIRHGWDGESPFPYGSSEDPSFRYCGDAGLNFQCARSPTERPDVIYKSGNYERDNDDPAKGSGIRYQEAMSYLKKAMAGMIKSKVELNGYYICEEGCDDKKPLFIFDFNNKYEDP